MPSTLPPPQVSEEKAELEKGVGIFKIKGGRHPRVKGESSRVPVRVFLPEAGKGVLPSSSTPQRSGGALGEGRALGTTAVIFSGCT